MSDLRAHLPAARAALRDFSEGKIDYLAGVHPGAATQLDTRTVFDALHRRMGDVLAKAHNPSVQVESPKVGYKNGQWLKSSSCVGINLRTCGGLLGAVKYLLTLPAHIDSIHLLPVFEPGVVGSLYGMASWHLNNEFFDADWARIVPAMRHVNDQLRAFVDICHGLGKTVGLDVIPHTDRFSEIALANPWLFEWVKRDDATLLDQRADLHYEVEEQIVMHLTGRWDPGFTRAFYSRKEVEICDDLFGDGDVYQRNDRRDELIQYLYNRGYETLPATMAPPYRGLQLSQGEAAVTTDGRGRRWREFEFTHPGEMSRVFGPLTRYKIWDRIDDNQAWEIDHDAPRMAVWNYVADHYRAIVEQYGFDFMRGDMSHVQTRPEGVPSPVPEPYDLLRYVKRACAKTTPHFAYFAESFLTADNYMTYGSEAEHLDASEAEVALGNLQNFAPNDAEFIPLLERYRVIKDEHNFAPAFTIFSADKDDPRFDANFNFGSVARYFFATFYTALPAYSSLGFRVRDKHKEPWPNEFYTKLYVFQYDEGVKATDGGYRWGENFELLKAIHEIDLISNLRPHEGDCEWEEISEGSGAAGLMVWGGLDLKFAVNFGVETIYDEVLPGGVGEVVFCWPREGFLEGGLIGGGVLIWDV